jgi:hypothetical protein
MQYQSARRALSTARFLLTGEVAKVLGATLHQEGAA